MQALAPVKLNLFLHVTGKRPDGYHTLQSLVAFGQDTGDILHISPADRLTLTITGPFAQQLPANPEDNIIWKAIQLLAEHTAQPSPAVHITLEKRIPVAAGIGGGSSDAATALKLLRTYGKLDIADTTLAEWSLTLGADLPMCLHGSAAWVEGIGEQVKPITLPTLYAVLVNPLQPVITADIFRHGIHPYSTPLTPDLARLQKEDYLIALLQETGNDLYENARQQCPELAEILSTLEATSGCYCARMSGSGATCFGLYETKAEADKAAASLQHSHPDWWVCATVLS